MSAPRTAPARRPRGCPRPARPSASAPAAPGGIVGTATTPSSRAKRHPDPAPDDQPDGHARARWPRPRRCWPAKRRFAAAAAGTKPRILSTARSRRRRRMDVIRRWASVPAPSSPSTAPTASGRPWTRPKLIRSTGFWGGCHRDGPARADRPPEPGDGGTVVGAGPEPNQDRVGARQILAESRPQPREREQRPLTQPEVVGQRREDRDAHDPQGLVERPHRPARPGGSCHRGAGGAGSAPGCRA